MSKEYCIICNQDVEGEVRKGPMITKTRNKVVHYIGEYRTCPYCGSTLDNEEIYNYNKRKIDEAYARLEEEEKRKRKEKEDTGKEKGKKKVIIGIASAIATVVATVITIIVKRKRKK